jgi:uncharacterized phage-associated protein
MTTGANTSIDVAIWFLDHALNDGEYLQPQKLHRLLYLAQAYYAVANYGRMLLPTVFVADEAGPMSPDIYRVLEQGRHYIEGRPLKADAEQFVESIWRRFGQHSTDYLTKQIVRHPPYAKALAEGPGTVISFEAMRDFYGASTAQQAPGGAPPLSDVLRPKVMRSHTGKPVNVQKWMPPAKGPAAAAKK